MSEESARLERIVVSADEPSEAAASWRQTLALESAGGDCLRAGSVLIEMRPAGDGQREGLSRLVIEVDDLAATLGRLQTMGMSLDPTWTGGVAIELVERAK